MININHLTRSYGKVELDKQSYHQVSDITVIPTFPPSRSHSESSPRLHFVIGWIVRIYHTPMPIYSSLRRFDLGTADFILCCLCLRLQNVWSIIDERLSCSRIKSLLASHYSIISRKEGNSCCISTVKSTLIFCSINCFVLLVKLNAKSFLAIIPCK